ncbi:Uncharacterised protein [Mycobacteroides abscessus subsp. abscessus]|nr:Uncharacterised protein [Mycobacteroides abscessus subsp. abscessus]SIM61188.1 Uncharacterised protein [Mycobacteroides abscessus subsp. abscessus]SKS23705.1 Uncharacterised protein [Mycobacteroides abscessus subsp. abscessus]SKV24093.1 Uncharacterised protein [Mycobacteroides abscessus subsp. abscessus]
MIWREALGLATFKPMRYEVFLSMSLILPTSRVCDANRMWIRKERPLRAT